MQKRALPLGLLILGLILTGLSMPVDAQFDAYNPWDLANTRQEGQFSFFDLPAGASTTGKPLDIGDLDGDGCGDIAITGHNASHPLGVWRGSVGHIRVFMNLCTIEGILTVENIATGDGFFTIFGAYDGDMAGTETYMADFNGDGYDDLLFSAQNSDGFQQQKSNAGAAYILFGAPRLAVRGNLDLQQPPDDMLVIYGADVEDRLGLWAEGGDFDHDGYHDVLLGANQADGIDNSRSNAGEVWIIYGAPDMIETYGQVINLSQPPPSATRIIGADFDDLLGSCVWGDDLNADGFDDAIVGAGLWRASSGVGGLSFGGGDGPGNTRYNSGEAFVIFGRTNLRGQTIDLADLLDSAGAPVDGSITAIYGADANDLLGEEIAVGDMDGDGRNDLILGTLIGDGPLNDQDEAGEAWVIYTSEPFRGQMFDLAFRQPERAVAIYPNQADSKAGDTLRLADMDGDGIDDLFYGAPDYDPLDSSGRSRPNAGLLAVIFGERGGLPHENGQIMVFDPPEDLRIRFIIGPNDNDMMPYALAVYDVDGDGVIDIAPNAMGGDGINDDQVNAGEIYVVSGAAFLSDDIEIHPTATAPPLTPTPAVTRTPLPEVTVTPSGEGNPNLGQVYYNETCAGCHGFSGEGVEGLGLPLIDSPLVLYASDLELLIFLRTGRPADHPDNTLGVSMPPSGGRPDWNNEIFAHIIAYLRTLRNNALGQ